MISCAALCAAACQFNADYTGGHYRCSDDVCPSGLVCVSGECEGGSGADARTDGRGSDGHAGSDGPPSPPLTCAMPGALTSGVPVSNTTVGRANGVSAFCSGEIMNGPDAEYTIAVGAGSSLQVSVSGFTGVVAYALAACTPAGQTPTCEGGSAASPGTSITVTPTAGGTQYVMVDSALAAGSGSYTLTVTIP